MRKVMWILVVVAVVLSGCASSHTLTFVESRNVELYEEEYVALFFNYTNDSGETAIPCEWVDVKAFQHGVELVVTVFTGEKVNGAVQCDTSIQAGATARVVWLFERVDDSPVSIEMSDGQKFTVE